MTTATKTEPAANGRRDVMEDLGWAARQAARQPPLDFDLAKHGFLRHAKGVIHVGAHVGQERNLYGQLPVVWVEPLGPVFVVLQDQIEGYPNQRAMQYLVADGLKHRFGVASNAGQSSSIFDFKLHKELWPEVGFIDATEIQSVTLDDLFRREDLDPNDYDTLVLDVQGAELLVLKGAGDCLNRFRWVLAEAADFDSYEGGCQLRDLDAYLGARGFARWSLHEGKGKPGVGTYYEARYRNTGIHSPAPAFASSAPLRLNIGAGATTIPGFTNLDRDTGQEAYPLPYPDGSVEEIVASHVLEHFSHREVRGVLTEWVRVLMPGGKLRLAVPDFEEVARLYLQGAPVNVQGYVMGGHNDRDDRHNCIFDRESLTEEMTEVGLERIGPWDDKAVGCAAGPHSLNLMGFKPSGPTERLTGVVRAVMSVPRFGPLMHPRCAERAFFQLGIEARSTSSCYWAQQISNCMEDAIAHPECEFVLTMDFDTVFSAADVLELYRLLRARPDVDAAFPMQAKRACEELLFSLPGKAPGTVRGSVTEADLTMNLLPANTGHFGLTLFRADSLRKFPRPWMVPEANAEGKWRDGHRDADIDFWRRFKAAGFRACLAPKVVVGHLEEVVKWPGKDLKPVYQTGAEYDEVGIPAEVAR